MRRPGWPRLATPAALALVAAAWTWPAARAGGGTGVGRHFDLPGTAWLLGSAHRWLWTLADPATGFPEGARYGRPDSFLAASLGALLTGLDPLRLHGLLQVVGVALSAWAAEALARALGARAPWSLLAGLAFACSGPAATALIEGHAYLVLDPWLPLCLLGLVRATAPGARPAHGLLAGLGFAGTLATSAYLGLSAAALGAAVVGAALLARRRGPTWPVGPLALAVATCLATGGAWLAAFARAGGPAALGGGYDAASRARYLVERSADLAGLLGSSPEVDRFGHAAAAVAPLTALALAALAPVVLRGGPADPGRAARRGLAAGGLALFVLALGPYLDLGPAWLPLPGLALAALPEVDLLRHPARLLWGAWLAAGVLGAVVATRLAAARPRAAWLLLPMALVDAFLVCGMPARQRTTPLATPGAYAGLDGPVLDLRPDAPGHAYELDAWLQAWACAAQLGHGQPIADDCVTTLQADNPAVARSRRVIDALLRGQPEQARAALQADGYAAVSLPPDLLLPGDRARLAAALGALDPQPRRSTDAGLALWLYRVGP